MCVCVCVLCLCVLSVFVVVTNHNEIYIFPHTIIHPSSIIRDRDRFFFLFFSRFWVLGFDGEEKTHHDITYTTPREEKIIAASSFFFSAILGFSSLSLYIFFFGEDKNKVPVWTLSRQPHFPPHFFATILLVEWFVLVD